MIRSRRRNPRRVADQRPGPAPKRIRREGLIALLAKDINPPKKRKGGGSESSDVSTSQPKEGSQNLAISFTSTIEATNPLAFDPFETPLIGAAQPLAAGDQPFPPTTFDYNALDHSALDPSSLLWDFAEYNAPCSTPAPPASMHPDDLEGYDYQSYYPNQSTSNTNPETADTFVYTSPPLTEGWATQSQHSVGSYPVQAPTTASTSASGQPLTVEIWGPAKGWTPIKAALDYSSKHSYLMVSGARKAGLHRSFMPMAPEYSHQGSTQYGYVTPTQWVNTSIKSEGFFHFPPRNVAIYIFPQGQRWPADVDIIIGRKLWPDEAEGSASVHAGPGL